MDPTMTWYARKNMQCSDNDEDINSKKIGRSKMWGKGGKGRERENGAKCGKMGERKERTKSP